MIKIKIFFISVIVLFLCTIVGNVYAAGSCTKQTSETFGYYTKHKWTVSTDSNGDMTETSCASAAIYGMVVQIEFWPNSSTPWTDGTADIQLRGINTSPAYNTDYDYVHGTGANLDSSITDADNIRAPLTTDGSYIWLHGVKVVPWLDEAGDTKSGVIYMIVKEK